MDYEALRSASPRDPMGTHCAGAGTMSVLGGEQAAAEPLARSRRCVMKYCGEDRPGPVIMNNTVGSARKALEFKEQLERRMGFLYLWMSALTTVAAVTAR